MNSKYLTIVIPYYKIAFFRETLKSLADQTDKNFSVFIGDDESPENPTELLKEFQSNFEFKYKRFENNLGSISLSGQWKRCVENVETEWFIILGDDDVLTMDAVAKFNSNARRTNVLQFNVVTIDENSAPISSLDYGTTSTVEFLVKLSQYKIVATLSEFVFRTEDYKRHGIIDLPKGFYVDNWMVAIYSDFGNFSKIDTDIYIRKSRFSLSGDSTNSNHVYNAASCFYDILANRYGFYFSKKNKATFYKYIVRGYVTGFLKKKWLLFHKEMFANLYFVDAIRFSLQILKYKISNK